MTLLEYIRAQKGNATSLAERLGVSPSYLSQMAAKTAAVSPQRAVLIEGLTDHAVTRKDLFPEDWRAIWPELEGAAA